MDITRVRKRISIFRKKSAPLENILILGLGGVGFYLGKRLIHEEYVITINGIDRGEKDAPAKDCKTIALVNKEDYLVLAATIGSDIALNKKVMAGNEILKFILRSEFISVAHLHGLDTEVVELVAAEKSSITQKPLFKLDIFFQKAGKNMTSAENTPRLPANIFQDRNHFPKYYSITKRM